VKAQLKRLKNLQPRNSKSKQSSFKKLYIKIWKQILVILKNEREVRASVNYVPQLQLILRLDTFIDPLFHQEIFGDDKILNAHFFIIFFDFRNEDIKKQVLEIFKYRS
jgi:predicted sulfurtransferase